MAGTSNTFFFPLQQERGTSNRCVCAGNKNERADSVKTANVLSEQFVMWVCPDAHADQHSQQQYVHGTPHLEFAHKAVLILRSPRILDERLMTL